MPLSVKIISILTLEYYTVVDLEKGVYDTVPYETVVTDYNEEINERQNEKNELEITYFTELAKEEERFSKKKAAELFKNKLLDTLEPGS